MYVDVKYVQLMLTLLGQVQYYLKCITLLSWLATPKRCISERQDCCGMLLGIPMLLQQLRTFHFVMIMVLCSHKTWCLTVRYLSTYQFDNLWGCGYLSLTIMGAMENSGRQRMKGAIMDTRRHVSDNRRKVILELILLTWGTRMTRAPSVGNHVIAW